jgi:hypothetical protein
MPRREFTSQKALQAHAEQTGNVCVLEGIAIRQHGKARRDVSFLQLHELFDTHVWPGLIENCASEPPSQHWVRSAKILRSVAGEDHTSYSSIGHCHFGFVLPKQSVKL